MNPTYPVRFPDDFDAVLIALGIKRRDWTKPQPQEKS